MWALVVLIMVGGGFGLGVCVCVCRYCKCEMPYNPDDLMVQCEGCKDW